jgi:hypothetical protein
MEQVATVNSKTGTDMEPFETTLEIMDMAVTGVYSPLLGLARPSA